MREIIFRGRDESWHYGNLVRLKYGSNYIESDGETYHVDFRTVGQYTGMDDRKENPIYEGDIVTYNLHIDKQNEPASVAVVAFIFAAFQVFMQKRQVEYHAYLGDCTNIEVIGNIHDNPELWEVDDDKK